MSGLFECVRWNACVHKLDLGLYSHPREFLGNGVRTHVNSMGKFSLYGKNSPQRTIEPMPLHHAATASPTHYQRAIPAPEQKLNEHKEWVDRQNDRTRNIDKFLLLLLLVV